MALKDKVATDYQNIIHLLHSRLFFHSFVLLIGSGEAGLFRGHLFVLPTHLKFFWFEYGLWNEKAE